MGIENWFKFETAKQRKKRMDKYYKKLYPHGNEQRKWEEARLNELFPNNKKTKSYHFELLILREKIADLSDPDVYDEDDEIPGIEEVIESWKSKDTVYRLSNEERERVAALALEENEKFG